MRKTKKPFILFITGVSGSGKSTVFEGLKKAKLGRDVEVHDIDEDGVPFGGRAPWRAYRVLNLFYEALGKVEKDISTIICGVSLPLEVIDCEYFNPFARVYFLQLKIPHPEHVRRVAPRFKNKGEKTDPLKFKISNKDLALRLRNQFSYVNNCFVVDSFKKSKQKVLKEVTEIIKSL